MKSFWQIALVIAALMAAVFGATYLTQNTTRVSAPTTERKEDSESERPSTALRPLVLRDLWAVWDRSIEAPVTFGEEAKQIDQARFVKYVEVGNRYQYDFWFYSQHPQPVGIGLEYESCTCTDLECFIFPEADWLTWQRETALATLMATVTGGDVWGPAAATVLMRTLDQKNSWVSFGSTASGKGNRAEAVATVPPGRPGIVRVNFRPKKLSEKSEGDGVRIILQALLDDGSYKTAELGVRYLAVPPVGYAPLILDGGELDVGEKRELECYLWSSTRERLEPKLELTGPSSEDSHDPCVEIGKLVPLSAEEMKAFPARLTASYGKMYEAVKPMCAYRLALTVHEKRGGKQLDIGPVVRRLLISTEAQTEPWKLPITVFVRGEVRIIGGDDRDRLSLGSFKAEREKSASVTVKTENRNLELEVVPRTDSSLKAELQPVEAKSGKEWRLVVTVPPETFIGDLPATTAVVLSIKGSTRKVRIPVTGNAYR